MQSKIDEKLVKLKSILDEKSISFKSEKVNIESEDGKSKVDGYAIETKNSYSLILPNFITQKAEFIVMNNTLVDHLIKEGMTNDEIMDTQKVWKHYISFKPYSNLIVSLEN